MEQTTMIRFASNSPARSAQVVIFLFPPPTMSSDMYHHHDKPFGMVLPFPNDFQDFSQVSLFVAVICIIEILVTIMITNLLPSGVEDKLYLNSCILTFPKVCIMMYFAVQVCWTGKDLDFEGLVYHTQDGVPLDYFNIGMFFCFYLAHSFCSIFNEIWKDGFGWATATMLVHHVFSISAYSLCMVSGRFGSTACLASLCEFTNFPLALVYITKTKGGGVKEFMEKHLGVLLDINGGLLWLSFIPFRMILFPWVWFKFYFTCIELKEAWPERWAQVWWSELIVHTVTMILLFFMSSLWFYKITVGVIKILNGMKASDATPEKAE